MQKAVDSRLPQSKPEIHLIINSSPVTLRFNDQPNIDLARQIRQTLLDAYIKNKPEKYLSGFVGKDVP